MKGLKSHTVLIDAYSICSDSQHYSKANMKNFALGILILGIALGEQGTAERKFKSIKTLF